MSGFERFKILSSVCMSSVEIPVTTIYDHGLAFVKTTTSSSQQQPAKSVVVTKENIEDVKRMILKGPATNVETPAGKRVCLSINPESSVGKTFVLQVGSTVSKA